MSSPPDRTQMKPRALMYNDLSPDDLHSSSEELCIPRTMNLIQSPKKPIIQRTCSPPYRRVRALRFVNRKVYLSKEKAEFGLFCRLFDTPSTPKTIIQKSTLSKLMQNETVSNAPTETSVTKITTNLTIDRPMAVHVHSNILSYPTANVNPFTPDSKRTISLNLSRNPSNYNLSFQKVCQSEIKNGPASMILLKYPVTKPQCFPLQQWTQVSVA